MAPEHTGTLLWKDQVLQVRKEKDDFFRSRGSPLPAHERASFQGLSYYEPDPRYRFEAQLSEELVRRVVVPRTRGDEVIYERVGTFRLPTPEGAITLVGFRTDTSEGEIFIPFKDATSGKETYGGGRYLEAHPLHGDRWLVDLNAAYHPFCVYNEEFTCPLPPRENWAKVPIRAGERLP